jgi:hypothetical protein
MNQDTGKQDSKEDTAAGKQEKATESAPDSGSYGFCFSRDLHPETGPSFHISFFFNTSLATFLPSKCSII